MSSRSSTARAQGWGSVSYIPLPAPPLALAPFTGPPAAAPLLGQFRATSVPGNAVFGSVFYSLPAIVAQSRTLSPLSMLVACAVLALWRGVLVELGGAMRLNGGNVSPPDPLLAVLLARRATSKGAARSLTRSPSTRPVRLLAQRRRQVARPARCGRDPARRVRILAPSFPLELADSGADTFRVSPPSGRQRRDGHGQRGHGGGLHRGRVAGDAVQEPRARPAHPHWCALLPQAAAASAPCPLGLTDLLACPLLRRSVFTLLLLFGVKDSTRLTLSICAFHVRPSASPSAARL